MARIGEGMSREPSPLPADIEAWLRGPETVRIILALDYLRRHKSDFDTLAVLAELEVTAPGRAG